MLTIATRLPMWLALCLQMTKPRQQEARIHGNKASLGSTRPGVRQTLEISRAASSQHQARTVYIRVSHNHRLTTLSTRSGDTNQSAMSTIERTIQGESCRVPLWCQIAGSQQVFCHDLGHRRLHLRIAAPGGPGREHNEKASCTKYRT